MWLTDDLDRRDSVFGLLGTFWQQLQHDNDFLQQLLRSKQQLARQTRQNLRELQQSSSRISVPLYHRENWFPWVVARKDLYSGDPLRYGDSDLQYLELTNLRYGQLRDFSVFRVPLPPGLVTAAGVADTVWNGKQLLVSEIDYWCDKQFLYLRQNPFELFPITAANDAEAANDTITLWFWQADFDRSTLAQQFGYAIGVHLPSTQPGYELLNATLDAVTQGSTLSQLQQALTAMTGIPVCREDGEVVQQLAQTEQQQFVVTDKAVYRLPLATTVTVQLSQRLYSGQSLCTAVQLHELRDGKLPADVTELALVPGFLDAAEVQEALAFQNQELPLSITTDEQGQLLVTFPVLGTASAVSAFWESVRRREQESGRTLAQLLTGRDQPLPQQLPATLNPAAWLVEQLLRYHLSIGVIRVQELPAERLGLWASGTLKKIIPPHTALLLQLHFGVDESINGDTLVESDVVLRHTQGTDASIDGSSLVQAFARLSAQNVSCPGED